jgi:hypothetical protein
MQYFFVCLKESLKVCKIPSVVMIISYIRWTKSEGEELDILSKWIKNIRKLLKSCIDHLSGKMHKYYV